MIKKNLSIESDNNDNDDDVDDNNLIVYVSDLLNLQQLMWT